MSSNIQSVFTEFKILKALMLLCIPGTFEMLGGTDRHISERIVKELQIDVSIDKFEDELLTLSEKVLQTAPLQKGAKRLLKHLDHNKIPVALATNSTADQVQLHAKSKPDIFKIFDHVVTATDPDVKHGKPHPDLYLTAARRFPDKPDPGKCLVFEDSSVGLQAAVAAGMQVILTPHQGIEKKYSDQAAMVLPNLLDFRPELFGLPPILSCKNNCPQVPNSPASQGFKPPASACDPCNACRRTPCLPVVNTNKCKDNYCNPCSFIENKAVLTALLIGIIFAILYRIW